MARTAEYSIKGYVYQFLKYLAEILAATEGTRITIEGAVEDIDVSTPTLTTAVQCKYHEQAEKFTLGKIYKPILLMLEHFSTNPSATPKVSYRLFCHFPDQSGARPLTRTELDTVLATTAEALRTIIARIATGVDHDEFLRRLTIEFGPSAEDLQKSVLASLKTNGFSADDVDAIIYPNAIQRIVDLATKSDVTDRTVDAKAFLKTLHDVRHVTFTRWTRELATRAAIFQRLRKELRTSLSLNSRVRHFIIDPSAIERFDEDIVKFIKKFVERYSCKYLHDNPPLFAFAGAYDVGKLSARIYDAGLTCADGMVGAAEFRETELFRRPMRQRQPFGIEFSLRLARRSLIPQTKQRADELFLVNVSDDPWVHVDVNVHRFEIERLSDLEYAFFLRDSYD